MHNSPTTGFGDYATASGSARGNILEIEKLSGRQRISTALNSISLFLYFGFQQRGVGEGGSARGPSPLSRMNRRAFGAIYHGAPGRAIDKMFSQTVQLYNRQLRPRGGSHPPRGEARLIPPARAAQVRSREFQRFSICARGGRQDGVKWMPPLISRYLGRCAAAPGLSFKLRRRVSRSHGCFMRHRRGGFRARALFICLPMRFGRAGALRCKKVMYAPSIRVDSRELLPRGEVRLMRAGNRAGGCII